VDSRKFLSVQEVADRWGFSYVGVRDVIRAGKLPAARLGGNRLKIDISDLEAYELAAKRSGADIKAA